MDVDESGRDDPTFGVDLTLSGSFHPTDLDDEVAVDRNVGDRRRRAGAIDDHSSPDHQVVWH